MLGHFIHIIFNDNLLIKRILYTCGDIWWWIILFLNIIILFTFSGTEWMLMTGAFCIGLSCYALVMTSCHVRLFDIYKYNHIYRPIQSNLVSPKVVFAM